MYGINGVPIWPSRIPGNSQYLRNINEDTRGYEINLLVLSFSPLFDARIALRECETFFFGTARRIGGKSSRMDRMEGTSGTVKEDSIREKFRKNAPPPVVFLVIRQTGSAAEAIVAIY